MKLIVANLKMTKDYQESLSWASFLMENLKNQENVIVCPSFPLLKDFVDIFRGSNVKVGAQDLSGQKIGAATGEVSSKMLKSLGVKVAIVGHSETRRLHHLTSSDVREKIKRLEEFGLLPIICLSCRTKEGLESELNELLSGINSDVILAFEPEEAIGSGKHMDPSEAEKIMKEIKQIASGILGHKPRVIYGGSVCKANACEFLQKEGIDGLLVGAAAKDQVEFCSLVNP